MDIEHGAALLVFLYALYGLVKLQNLYRRTKDLEFIILLSIILVVGLDAGIILYGGSSIKLFSRFQYVLALVPLLMFIICRHLAGARSQAVSASVMLRNAFQSYLGSASLDRLAEEQVTLSGEKKVLTVLHCNIKGFRFLSDKLGPQEFIHFLNTYLSDMSDIILQYKGTLGKYVGDEIWAFWGAPLSEENPISLASEASFALVKRLKQLRPVWEKKGLPRVEIQIGLNTGNVIVGNMGSNKRFDYSIVGYQARLAKVLGRLNKVYGTKILLPESMVESLKERFIFREVDWVATGKKKPVRVYELLDSMDGLSKYTKFFEVYTLALAAYRKREWLKAKSLFEEASTLHKGEGVCKVYMDRIKGYIHSPPTKDWDGVMRL
ncbi:MAG: adenylate/guanylate cyclase domain-containing protein [Nanoarchaeota archaeon]